MLLVAQYRRTLLSDRPSTPRYLCLKSHFSVCFRLLFDKLLDVTNSHYFLNFRHPFEGPAKNWRIPSPSTLLARMKPLKARYFSKSFACTFQIKTVYLTRSMTSLQFVKIWITQQKNRLNCDFSIFCQT